MRYIYLCIYIFCISCMDYGPIQEEDFDAGASGHGLFVVNEGNFMYGNASLSYYNIDSSKVENEIFLRSNGIKLGDVAQSMCVHNGLGYVVVNNSGVIFVIDVNTFKVQGKITGFTSPRYIHFVSEEKAYVTDLYDPRIAIVNPSTYEITGYITVSGHPSTEQMVQYGQYVFTNCWSYDNKILVIDTKTDALCDSIEVGIQPTSLVLDCNGKIWTITDGGYKGSPYGHTAPALYCINAATREVEKTFNFSLNESPSEIQLNGTNDTLYFINKSIWQMSVNAEYLPIRSFVAYTGTIYYGLTVNPITSEVYVADAIDYVQLGMIYRYTSEGKLLDSFYVGIIPGAFCWR